MTFSSRGSEADAPQPFDSTLKNLRFQIERVRYAGGSVTTVRIDTLEELVDAYETVHGDKGDL